MTASSGAAEAMGRTPFASRFQERPPHWGGGRPSRIQPENQRGRFAWWRGALAFLVAALLAGCGQGGALSPGDSAFEGLPRDAVAETLSLPRVRANLEGESADQQRSLAQASVRTLIACREALRVYLTWIRTGIPPEISRGPVPAHPLEPGNTAVEEDYARLAAAVTSGEPDRLRALLLAEGGCGPNWPAEPGGPTIAQVVQEQGA